MKNKSILLIALFFIFAFVSVSSAETQCILYLPRGYMSEDSPKYIPLQEHEVFLTGRIEHEVINPEGKKGMYYFPFRDLETGMAHLRCTGPIKIRTMALFAIDSQFEPKVLIVNMENEEDYILHGLFIENKYQ